MVACASHSASDSSGANNLIISSSVGFSGTLTDDPQLAPLANHFGDARTHALLATSPAIDHGNNAAGLTIDERGATRVVGTSADIGAYERQANDDELYYSSFD